jgi:hypothetical protein
MDESSEKFKLNIEQSTYLLKLGLVPDNEKNNQVSEKNREDLLLDMLASKLPVNPALFESMPAVLRPLSDELDAVSGLSLGKLIQNTQTKTTLLRNIKEYAKQLGTSAPNEIERDVALVVYFAAIAHALVFHNVKITKHSYESLRVSFSDLVEKPWLPIELARLFTKAGKVCNDKES